MKRFFKKRIVPTIFMVGLLLIIWGAGLIAGMIAYVIQYKPVHLSDAAHTVNPDDWYTVRQKDGWICYRISDYNSLTGQYDARGTGPRTPEDWTNVMAASMADLKVSKSDTFNLMETYDYVMRYNGGEMQGTFYFVKGSLCDEPIYRFDIAKEIHEHSKLRP